MVSRRTLLTLVFVAIAVAASGLALTYGAIGYFHQKNEHAKSNYIERCTASQVLCINSPSDREIGPGIGNLSYIAGIDRLSADGYDPAFGHVNEYGHKESGYYFNGIVWTVSSGNYSGFVDISLNLTDGDSFKLKNIRLDYTGKSEPYDDIQSWLPVPFGGIVPTHESNHAFVEMSLTMNPGRSINIFVNVQRTNETEKGSEARLVMVAHPHNDTAWSHQVLDSVAIHSVDKPEVAENIGWVNQPIMIILTFPTGVENISNVTKSNVTSSYGVTHIAGCKWIFEDQECDLESHGWETTIFSSGAPDDFDLLFGEKYDGTPISPKASFQITTAGFEDTPVRDIPITDGQFYLPLKFEIVENEDI